MSKSWFHQDFDMEDARDRVRNDVPGISARKGGSLGSVSSLRSVSSAYDEARNAAMNEALSHEFLGPELLRDVRAHTGALLEIAQLSGGITNHNFRLEAEGGRFMLRVAGAGTDLLGINRAHEFECAMIAHAVGVGAKPVALLAQHGAMLTRFIDDAQTFTPESATLCLERIVAALRRTHAAPDFPSRFSPFETVRQYHALALERGVRFPDDLPWVLERMNEIEKTLGPHAKVGSCHNDLLPTNFLDDGTKIWIVDWEYAGNGDVFFDLGNFAVNLELDESRCERLLALYFGHSNPTLMAQLQLMRLASDLREAFWGYLQSGISRLEFDYVAYGAKHLDRFRENVARDEYTQWLERLL